MVVEMFLTLDGSVSPTPVVNPSQSTHGESDITNHELD